ncbi:Cytochrome P450 704C1 [Linum perenne]
MLHFTRTQTIPKYKPISTADCKTKNTKMDGMILCFTILCSTILCSLLLTTAAFLSYLFLKCYAGGKSINNSDYPPVKGTVFHQMLYFNTLYDHHTDIARDHPTFRLLAPDCSSLYTTDPRNVEHVLKANFGKYSKGKFNQEVVTEVLGEGIFAADGEKWKQQRKLASFEFSTRVLRDFSCSVFRKNAAKLVGIVSELAGGGAVFDFQDIMMRCTLDSIFKVGFGVELNCLLGTSKEGIDFMKAFDEANALTYWRYVDPFWRLKRLFNFGAEASLKRNVQIIDSFVTNVISTKRRIVAEQRLCNDKEDILSRFLVESQKDPEKMNDQYLRDIILNFMIAGKDTSAGTLSWFFYMMSKYPLIQEKAALEVLEVAAGSNGSCGSDQSVEEFIEGVNDATLDRLQYLHAALTETLRLYPAVPIDGRSSEDDDVLPDGFKVKKGDSVNYMAYSMGRMPYIWGDDAEDFRPERWLSDDGVFQPQSPFKFVAFHVCTLDFFLEFRIFLIISACMVLCFAGRSEDMFRKRLRLPADEDHGSGAA